MHVEAKENVIKAAAQISSLGALAQITTELKNGPF